jgi:uncharacterized protein
MNIFYNTKDITNDVEPLATKVIDNASYKRDSLEVTFSDTDKIWSKWKPKKNDVIQVKENGFDSGAMYIDGLIQRPGMFSLIALSTPQNSNTTRTKAWEEIRFLTIVNEIADRYKFKVKTFGIENHLYSRVDQIEASDFSFLANRCILEGYGLKISDKTIIIYNEHTEEQKEASSIVYENDMIGDYEFNDGSNSFMKIYQKCIVKSNHKSGFFQSEFEDKTVFGASLVKTIYCSNKAEADRYTKGLLRNENKYLVSGAFKHKLNKTWAAGTNIEIKDIGMFDGKYFIDKIIHDFINDKSFVNVRKALEGY